MSKQAIVNAELARIMDERGTLVPREVLDLARDEGNPLHPFIDWQDRSAAEHWRLYQVSTMIRSFKLRVETIDAQGVTTEHRVRGYVPSRYVDDEVREGYVATVQLDERQRQLMERQLKREWSALRRRWEHWDGFWSVILADAEGNAA